MKKYTLVACGGTFDLFHVGHKYFLEKVFEYGENVLIGLTSDYYVSVNKPGLNIASFAIRKTAIENFLQEKNLLEKAKIVSINDIYGPLLDSELLVLALAVTAESRNTASLINKKRQEKGLPVLEIIEIMQKSDEEHNVLSSTRIRQGEIDASGRLLLPLSVRSKLQVLWGDLVEIPDDSNPHKIITVGDATTKNFVKKGIIPKLSVIDHKIERKETKDKIDFGNTATFFPFVNPAGAINNKAFMHIEELLKKENPCVLEVDGEEDLLVLPAILAAPVGFYIYYGQPHEGLVRITVNEEIKTKVRELLALFDTST